MDKGMLAEGRWGLAGWGHPTSQPPSLAPQSLGIDPAWGRGRTLEESWVGKQRLGTAPHPMDWLLQDCGPLPNLGASGVLTQISRFVLEWTAGFLVILNDLRISHLTSELSSILLNILCLNILCLNTSHSSLKRAAPSCLPHFSPSLPACELIRLGQFPGKVPTSPEHVLEMKVSESHQGPGKA